MSNNATSLKTSPNSIEAEKGVLGSILLDAESSIEKCLSKNVCPEAFFDPRHKVLFQSFLDMDKEKNPMDAVTIKNWLNNRDLLKVVGGEDYLLLLQDSTIVPSHVESYSDIVMDKFLCRKLIKKSSDVIDSVYNSNEEASILVDKAQEALFSINYESDNNIQPWKDSIKAAFSDIENMDPNNKITGVNTGYIELNKRLSGFQKTDMIVIAARPGMGKTSLALNLVEHAALGDQKLNKPPVPVAVFSLEMSREQLAKRMLFSNANVDPSFLKVSGDISPNHHEKLTSAVSKLQKANIYIDDTPALDVNQLRAKARRLRKRKKVELFVVDYLQLLNCSEFSRDGRQRETMAISGAIKALAKELNVPIIVLSQLSRASEGRSENKPKLSDLRDSGAIEQDADIVMLLYRSKYYNSDSDDNTAILDIAKYRHGSTGPISLTFIDTYTRFENYAAEDDYSYSYNENNND